MSNLESTVSNLTDMEIDIIGEVMNISMGSAATAMSTILDRKVNITTPRIETKEVEDFEFTYLEPVVGVIINYVEGIDGSNILLLREDDLKKILRHLLSMEPEDELEFDEISMSAVCEIMNQMMGSAASALASFLGRIVNISPPEVLDTTDSAKIRGLFSTKGDTLVSIKFNLNIDGLVESEFISAMEPRLAREIINMSLGASMSEEAVEEAPAPAETAAPAPQPAMPAAEPAPEVAPAPAAPPQPTFIEGIPPAPQPPQVPPQYGSPAPQGMPLYGQPEQPIYAQPEQPVYAQPPYPQQPYMPPPYPQQPYGQQPYTPQVSAQPYTYRQLGAEKPGDLHVDENNLELIMSVPIQITVELGRTKKKIKDIAELSAGNIVELDRQAGDQVDVIANGRLIARGDVVVVDDNYSVRITEIIKSKENVSESK